MKEKRGRNLEMINLRDDKFTDDEGAEIAFVIQVNVILSFNQTTRVDVNHFKSSWRLIDEL